MANTKTKPTKTKTQRLSDKLTRMEDYVADIWNDVNEGRLSANQVEDRLDKVMRMIDDLKDSL